MSIHKLTACIYKYVKRKNEHATERVGLQDLHHVGRANGFSRGEVGYAIQLLKEKDMLRYYRKSGWVAMKI